MDRRWSRKYLLMQEQINVDVLTNWVVMLRADVDGAMWLSDDDVEARFYEKVAHESSRIVPAAGLALPLLDAVLRRGLQGVVATIGGVASSTDAEDIFRPSSGDIAS